ncbi:required for meiotic nuclear division protein 1 homolog isoform X2 [Physella acuta]|nr:required for meiotic nuclear division protein 1 homolog isoform X2 [Physella acuta]
METSQLYHTALRSTKFCLKYFSSVSSCKQIASYKKLNARFCSVASKVSTSSKVPTYQLQQTNRHQHFLRQAVSLYKPVSSAWCIFNQPSCCYSSSTAVNSAILMDKSALQVKRPARKKVPTLPEEAKTVQIDNVVAYAVAEEIRLPQLQSYLIKQGLYTLGKLPADVTHALHVRGKYNVDHKPKEIFVFEDGTIVFWCVPEVERGAFLNILAKYSDGPYISSLVLFEREEMDFTYVSGKTCLTNDIIQLKDNDPGSPERLLELYSFSNALAQSVKLSIWEGSLNKFVTSIETVTEELRHGKKISMSRKQIQMKIGELFSLRHLINLSSELLDTPDFYWDREALEPLYLSLYHYLNIARRIRVINEKMNHCSELTELVNSQLNDRHHTRLEVMIIVLIMVEVVFECIHYAERYFNNREIQK